MTTINPRSFPLLLGAILVLLSCSVLVLSVTGQQDAGEQRQVHLLSSGVEIQSQEQAAAPPGENNKNKRLNIKLPKMFDFERFKHAFRKVYRSSIEEGARLKLFLARSFRAFISAVGYKHRGSSYYLAVNERSDWTKAELERGENKFLASDHDEDGDDKLERELAKQETRGEEQEELLDPEELEAELAVIERHSDDPRYAQLAEELRKARDSTSKARRSRRSAGAGETRDFDIERAFERSTSGPPAAKLEKVTGNNPDYQPPELMSMGTHDEYVNYVKSHPEFKMPIEKFILNGDWRDYQHLPVKSKYKTVTYVDSFWSLLGLGDATKETRNVAPTGSRRVDEKLTPVVREGTDDVVWVDHRRSKCLPEVQNQRQCGSCYAFAITAFFEHAYCRETSKLAKFSEQYLIDCGDRIALHGCNGGSLSIAGDFIANFGLELLGHYPYMERQEMCPYVPETEMSHMGYIRLDLSHMSTIPVPIWEDYLEYSPIVVSINTAGDYQEYGGGIWDGLKCTNQPKHAMLLIGHGREDGEEYWLMRNSYGPDWGEEGHFRLNKNSNCIQPRKGHVWGTRNGANVRLWPERNKHVPQPVAKDAYYRMRGLMGTAGNTVNYFKSFIAGGEEAED